MGEAESNLVAHEYISPWRLIMKEFSSEFDFTSSDGQTLAFEADRVGSNPTGGTSFK